MIALKLGHCARRGADHPSKSMEMYSALSEEERTAFATSVARLVDLEGNRSVLLVNVSCNTETRKSLSAKRLTILLAGTNQVVRWGWNANGWASPWSDTRDNLLFGCGSIDFAGSGVVSEPREFRVARRINLALHGTRNGGKGWACVFMPVFVRGCTVLHGHSIGDTRIRPESAYVRIC